MVVTADFSDWGYRDIGDAATILELWSDQKLTRLADYYFDNDGSITVNFNQNSGIVFLSNSDYQVLVESDGKLELFITTGWTGQEGTLDDLADDADDSWEKDDLEEVLSYEEYLSSAHKKKLKKLLNQ